METPTAAPCRSCDTTAGYFAGNVSRPWRGRGLCHRCYNRLYYHDALAPYPLGGGSRGWDGPTIPTGLVTPAMIGIRPGQPPTDPGLTPKRVFAIGNTNLNRATVWLLAHGHGIRDTLAVAVWEPATEADARRQAA